MYSKNINEKIAPASLTKLMTAIILLDKYEMNDNIEIKIVDNEIKGKIAYLEDGQLMQVSTLIDFLLVFSANDAAHAAALAVSNTEEEFVQLMNSKAQFLGMTNTNYTNVHGLDEVDHFTTINDLLILTLETITYDGIITSVRKDSFTASINNSGPVKYYSTNELLIIDPNYTGIKTGWTSEAGLTFIGLYQTNDRNIITITNKSTVDESKSLHFIDTQILTDISIQNYNLIKLLNTSDTLLHVYSGSSNYKLYSPNNIEIFDNIYNKYVLKMDFINSNKLLYSYGDKSTFEVSIPKTEKISIFNKIFFWMFV